MGFDTIETNLVLNLKLLYIFHKKILGEINITILKPRNKIYISKTCIITINGIFYKIKETSWKKEAYQGQRKRKIPA